MNKNEILARLQRGESMDVIADELATMLNEANAEYAKEKADEAAAKEAARLAEAKREAATKLADAIFEYSRLIDDSITEADRLSGADIEEVMDQVLPLITAIKDVKPKTVRVKVKNADEALSNFFSMFGL